MTSMVKTLIVRNYFSIFFNLICLALMLTGCQDFSGSNEKKMVDKIDEKPKNGLLNAEEAHKVMEKMQKIGFNGKVQNGSEMPIPGVVLSLTTNDHKIGDVTTMTDKNGNFSLMGLLPGNYNIVASYEGKKTEVEFTLPLQKKLIIQLEEKPIN